jgi:hypothetical protein
MILKCDCRNSFMDKMYGVGMRVMNKTAKERMYRCTVCLKEKEVQGKSEVK